MRSASLLFDAISRRYPGFELSCGVHDYGAFARRDARQSASENRIVALNDTDGTHEHISASVGKFTTEIITLSTNSTKGSTAGMFEER